MTHTYFHITILIILLQITQSWSTITEFIPIYNETISANPEFQLPFEQKCMTPTGYTEDCYNVAVLTMLDR